MKSKIIVLIAFFCLAFNIVAKEKTLNISVFKFGTVNWLLESIKLNKLDKKYGFKLNISKFMNPSATTLAVKTGSADMAVSDWIWLSAQRNKGEDFLYMPYSSSIGSLMVDPEKGIKTLKDLKGKKVGIVGGPSDKGWTLIRAIAQKEYGIELANEVEMVFGAPPLLKKKIRDKELDAIIIYWQHASELESYGFKPMFTLNELYAKLGFNSPLPLLGFMFKESFLEKNRALVDSFRKAYREAQLMIVDDKASWDALGKIIKPKNEKHNDILYREFVRGVPDSFGENEIEAAKKMYALLAKYGDKIQFGKNKTLDTTLFYLE